MSGITDDDIDATIALYHAECGFGVNRKGLRAAAEEIERLVLERVKAEPKPMQEPVSDEEARVAHANYRACLGSRTEMDAFRLALDQFLARRAAATRAEVVVTDGDIDAAMEIVRGKSFENAKSRVTYILNVFADRLNGKNERPVDPNVEKLAAILRDAGIDAETADATAKRATAELIAMLDARKP